MAIKQNAEEQATNKLMMRELLTSDDYFDWLDSFSKNYIALCASQAQFLSTNNQDRAKIVFIRVLFNILDNYAKEHGISSDHGKGGNYYLFSNNNTKYQVGCYSLGDEVDYYCRRIDHKTTDKFIDISEIRKDAGLEQDKIFDLKQLKRSILQLLNSGFNKDEILWVVEKTVDDVKVKKIGSNIKKK